MSLPAFSRLPVTLALPPLLQALARIPEAAWKPHFNTGYYDGDWSGVALISPADARGELSHGAGVAVEREPWLRDATWACALDLPLSIRSARLLRLGPGGRIHEHRDYDLGAPDADRRLHIPLLSPPGVDFMLDGQRIPMNAGECWFLDLARPHSVDNWGEGERIHLVLDCRPEAWLDQQIAAGLATTPAAGIGRAAGDLARFRALLESEPALCEALQGLEDTEAFIACTLALAAERGLRFGREDLRAAMRQGRNAWSRQWSF
ncbi:aspartyl/asparaginyl beta-hydroxylase domain-containing protein [Pseudomonas sp. RHF3.3-3]|uniref:aspartyl/asparaginyl beta-hydroxylase domain-containing protein n=1 Tax=Pseudomonas sp. RHF3.3-3 TaxID=3396624 RepID=UPI003A8629C1